MEIGIHLPQIGPLANREGITAFAQLAEELGFDSLWVSDHVIVPRSLDSKYPYSRDGSFPVPPDFPFLEPLAVLLFAAGVTTKPKLGTTILVIPMRNPIVTAKMLSTLDVVSNGRLILGVGAGWMGEEFRALGVPFDDRGPRTDEYVAAMRALWSQERASFKGRFVSFSEVFCRPLPADRTIPIIVGGDTRAAARRAGRLGDGYFPARGASPELLGEMRRAAEAAGRNPDDIEITVSAPTSPEEIEALARRGVSRVAVPVSAAAGLPAQVKTPDDVLRYGKTMIERFRDR
jgi:probable F420-dependent oxidoreductase